MSTEQMRQEFEATVRAVFADLGSPEPDLRRNSTDDYLQAVHATAWWAWQASRAAVVIRLPDAIQVSDRRGWSRTHALAHNNAIHSCELALEAAGLKVEP